MLHLALKIVSSQLTELYTRAVISLYYLPINFLVCKLIFDQFAQAKYLIFFIFSGSNKLNIVTKLTLVIFFISSRI